MTHRAVDHARENSTPPTPDTSSTNGAKRKKSLNTTQLRSSEPGLPGVNYDIPATNNRFSTPKDPWLFEFKYLPDGTLRVRVGRSFGRTIVCLASILLTGFLAVVGADLTVVVKHLRGFFF